MSQNTKRTTSDKYIDGNEEDDLYSESYETTSVEETEDEHDFTDLSDRTSEGEYEDNHTDRNTTKRQTRPQKLTSRQYRIKYGSLEKDNNKNMVEDKSKPTMSPLERVEKALKRKKAIAEQLDAIKTATISKLLSRQSNKASKAKNSEKKENYKQEDLEKSYMYIDNQKDTYLYLTKDMSI